MQHSLKKRKAIRGNAEPHSVLDNDGRHAPRGGGGVLDRRDVLNLMHGRSRMTIEGGGGGERRVDLCAHERLVQKVAECE